MDNFEVNNELVKILEDKDGIVLIKREETTKVETKSDQEKTEEKSK